MEQPYLQMTGIKKSFPGVQALKSVDLEAYSGDPDGVMAPDSLLELGLALDSLGASNEACTMLGELTTKFPGSAASEEARSAKANMGCV